MKTSGLVLDIYDDLGGAVVRSIYPTQDQIPDVVKTASVLSSEQREKLPDEAFALVLMNNGEKLRKYACIDEGNTTLAIEFFMKTGHMLPLEAQKVAASNLLVGCELYGIKPPEDLVKMAAIGGTVLNALPALTTAVSLPGQIRERRAENDVLGQGGNIITGADRAMLHKQAADSIGSSDGTASAPASAPVGNNPTSSKTVILKTARQLQLEKDAEEIAHLVFGEHAHHKGEKSVFPDDNSHHPVGGKAPASEPQGKKFTPHVDVSNSAPPVVLKEKKAERYAAPSEGKYPLDSYLDVQRASSYFDKYASVMSPDLRREYCTNLVPRADELGIKVSSDARRYGSSTYAHDDDLKIAYQTRKQIVGNIDEFSSTLDELYSKVAEVDPELFAATLAEFDKVAGIDLFYDQHISDPYYSTFGDREKTAASKNLQWSEVIGNDVVTQQDLVRLSKIGQRALKSTFSEEFASEFRKDPVGIFKSLPRDQKIIVMRMSTDNTGPGIELTA